MNSTTEIEIKRRFLTAPDALAALALDGATGTLITQGYLSALTRLSSVGRVRHVHNRQTDEQ